MSKDQIKEAVDRIAPLLKHWPNPPDAQRWCFGCKKKIEDGQTYETYEDAYWHPYCIDKHRVQTPPISKELI